MKKQIKLLYVALAMVACNKVDNEEVVVPSDREYSVSLSTPNSNSKLAPSYDDQSGSWKSVWEEGDKIGAWANEAGIDKNNNPVAASFDLTLLEGAGGVTAKFSGNKSLTFVNGEPEYFIYPSTGFNGEAVQINMVQQSFDVENPDEEWPENMRMVADAESKSFKYFTALFNFNINLTNATAGTSITSVEVEGSNLIANAYRYIDYPANTDRESEGWGAANVASVINTKNWTLTGGASSQTVKVVFAAFKVCNLDFKITVKEGDTKTHVYRVTKDVLSKVDPEALFENGKYHNISLDVDLSTSGEDWDSTIERYSFTGDGTAASPFLINNLDDFKGLVSNTTADIDGGENNHEGDYFRLETDLTLDATTGQVGGTAYDKLASFYGVFDGNGHTITTANKRPLFGILGASGVVKNLIAVYQGTGSFVSSALVVHQNYGVVDNCLTKGYMELWGGNLAGVVKDNRGLIVNCVNRIDFNIKKTGVGAGDCAGITSGAGASNSAGLPIFNGTVINCANFGSFIASKSIAGIAARYYKNSMLYLANVYSNSNLKRLYGSASTVGFVVDDSKNISGVDFYGQGTIIEDALVPYDVDAGTTTSVAGQDGATIAATLNGNVANYQTNGYPNSITLPEGVTLNQWRVDANGNVLPLSSAMGDIEAPALKEGI